VDAPVRHALTPPGGRRAAAIGDAWRHYWFTPIPPHVYALLRVLFGALGSVYLLIVSDLDAFWTLEGLVPGGETEFKSFFRAAGSEAVGPRLLYFASLASFACMTIGLKTWATVPMSLVAALLQVSWNSLPLSGAHVVIKGVLFCLIWADCGSVWSLDAWIDRRRGRGQPPRLYPIAPLRLIRFQIGLIYLSAGLWKLYSPLWRDGSALYYVLNNNLFHRFPYSLSSEWVGPLTLLTYATLVWELGFAPAMFHPISRRVFLVIGIFMHVGMAAVLELGLFSYAMLCSYVAFLDPWRVGDQRWFQARARVHHRSNDVAVPGAESTAGTSQRSDSFDSRIDPSSRNPSSGLENSESPLNRSSKSRGRRESS
jgi:hypothetical protein